MLLKRISENDVPHKNHAPVDDVTLQLAGQIIADVRTRGAIAVREHAERLGDLTPGASMFISRAQCDAALAALPRAQQELLRRVADRIATFAHAQRDCLSELSVTVPGGVAGHTIAPMESAGCYAPGGRFPLPSSVLMTAVTARTAGVKYVVVASPKPTQVTLAAAAVAKADGVLAVGGAQAIAAMAYGIEGVPACDIVVGPGNRYVTAAKQLVASHCAIDMLAGPSELVVLADESGNAEIIAADLLAQAEHDTDAFPALITTSPVLADGVESALQRQLAALPQPEIARSSLANGFCVVTKSTEAAIDLCNRLAPEHLEVHVQHHEDLLPKLQHYGALFAGNGAAEVFGDYGVGPNHVLPTSGGSRFSGGLSVLTFLRIRTWLHMQQRASASLVEDTAALARLEGLEAHARAALARLA